MLSTFSPSSEDCLALGGAYLTLGLSRVLHGCASEAPVAGSSLPFLITARLPVALPVAGKALPGKVLVGSPCRMTDPSLSAWKTALPAKNVQLCTATIVPE
jgi:hypothetical protein